MPARRERLRPTWDIKTYQYWVRIPARIIPGIIDEAAQMAAYWNRLCDRLNEAWQEEGRLLGPDYQRLCQQAEALREQIEQSSRALRSSKSGDVEGPHSDIVEAETRRAELVGEHRQTWRSVRALRSARRTDPNIAPRIKELWDRYERDIRILGLSSGCHQSNRAKVASSFRQAVTRLRNGAGRPRKRHIDSDDAIDTASINRITLGHRFGGGGVPVPRCFSNAGGLFHLVRVPDDAYASNVRTARYRRLTTGQMRLRTGVPSESTSYLAIPFSAVLHRPLPHNGIIKAVELAGRRSFGAWSWRLNVTLEQPPPDSPAFPDHRPVAGLDLNWRHIEERRGEGAIRLGAVVDSAGERYFLTLPLVGQRTRPPHRRRRFTDYAHLIELQRRVDGLLESTKARLKTLLTDCADLPEPVVAWAANLTNVRRRGLLTGLSLLERHQVAPEAQILLRSRWLVEDQRIRKRILRLSEHLTNRRMHLYRNLALALCRRYRVIAIKGDFAVSRVSRTAQRHRSANGSYAGHRTTTALTESGRYRQWAAVKTFALCLEEAAQKCRTVIFKGTGAFVTVAHDRCGTVVERTRDVELYCETCGVTFDQDINAAHNLLLQIPAHESEPLS